MDGDIPDPQEPRTWQNVQVVGNGNIIHVAGRDGLPPPNAAAPPRHSDGSSLPPLRMRLLAVAVYVACFAIAWLLTHDIPWSVWSSILAWAAITALIHLSRTAPGHRAREAAIFVVLLCGAAAGSLWVRGETRDGMDRPSSSTVPDPSQVLARGTGNAGGAAPRVVPGSPPDSNRVAVMTDTVGRDRPAATQGPPSTGKVIPRATPTAPDATVHTPERPDASPPPPASPPRTDLARAKTLYDDRDYSSAFPLFRDAVATGSAEAMAYLGISYMQGRGTLTRYDLGLRWLREAAARGDGRGMNALGIAYKNAIGVEKDCNEALRWFRAAWEKRYPDAPANIGEMYRAGCGVPGSIAEARRWYGIGADAGSATAMYNLGVLYAEGADGRVDDAAAVQWYRQAANAGNADAMSNLGQFYVLGRGVSRDHAQAASLYRRAAALGSATALNNLGQLYTNGWGVTKNLSEARSLFEQSAAKGLADAMVNLGVMYENGWGGPRDPDEAARLYQRAADRGNERGRQALRNLGR